jgi:microcystin-dependent protein
MSNDSNMIVQAGSLPETYCPTSYQDLYNAMVERLIVRPPNDLSFFVTGSVAPTSDVGPWLKDGLEWWVWDVTLGAYRPMTFSSLQNTFVPTGVTLDFMGLAADIPDGYLLCDGTEYAVADWPALFGVIGNEHGGTAPFTFKVPDLRNMFKVGWQQDDAGKAKSNVSDGATLLQSRAYTVHNHTLPGQINTPQDGTNATTTHYPGGNTTGEVNRAIPPFYTAVIMIKT